MGKNPLLPTQEIIFGSSDKAVSKRIAAQVKASTIRKIAPRIYTSNFTDDPSAIIRRNWYYILSHLHPDTALSHRSALEFKPTSNGHVYLTTSYAGNTKLPGLIIHLLLGPKTIEGDKPFFGNLYVSQEARAYLENLQPTRNKGEESKALTLVEIEEKLENIIRVRGEAGLNQLRDQARTVSKILGWQAEFIKLDMLISNLLATGSSKKLTSPIAQARALGEPVDAARIKLFENLYEELAGETFPYLTDKNTRQPAYQTFAFFESYFSNYIEGTEFTIEEAKEIIGTATPMPTRREDSHDILGTYQLVSNREEMGICPATANELLDILRRRHAILMHARTSKHPGEFKHKNNRAGNTEFVDWRLVVGTLKRGFEWYQLLQEPFQKAVYMMFLISEVHPFTDSNGRIARIMMNAELSSKGLSKIIIPTVYRDDYMGALRKLTRQQVAAPYIKMLLRAYQFSATLHSDTIDGMEKQLLASEAFMEPTEGRLRY